MKSILFTTENLNVGGIQRVTIEIASRLQEAGYDINIIKYSFAKSFFQTSVPLIQMRFTWKNWIARQIRRVFHKLFPSLVDGYAEHMLINSIKEHHYDVIIFNPESSLYIARIRNEFPDVKCYSWIHNNFDKYKSVYFSKCFNELLANVFKADGVICLESYTASKWREYNNNVVVIHNPITLSDHSCTADLNSKIISFTGRLLIEQKGLDFLVEIASQLPADWKISVAGSGSDGQRFHELILEHGLRDRFIFRGALSGQDLIDHYLNSSIFLLPSRWEGMPLVAIEAMSLGLPVVSFDIPAMLEVTDHGKYGLLAKYADVKEITAKLILLIDDKGLRYKFSKLSLERSEAFSSDVIIRDWKKMLDSVN